MAEYYSIVSTSHGGFIHSYTDGHLGCFRMLVIVYNTAMHIGVLMFFQISVLVPSDIFPEMGSVGQKADPFFEISPYCFPQWLHQYASPPTVPKGSPFSTSLTALGFDLLMIAILTGVRRYPDADPSLQDLVLWQQ